MNKTTLKWLSTRYRGILIKCAMLNAAIFIAAPAAMAIGLQQAQPNAFYYEYDTPATGSFLEKFVEIAKRGADLQEVADGSMTQAEFQAKYPGTFHDGAIPANDQAKYNSMSVVPNQPITTAEGTIWRPAAAAGAQIYDIVGTTSTTGPVASTPVNVGSYVAGDQYNVSGTFKDHESRGYGDNSSSEGAALFIGAYGAPFKVVMSAAEFIENHANNAQTVGGGAVYAEGDVEVEINGGKFDGNKSAGQGGAIVNGTTKMTIDGTAFTGNEAQKNGGAIVNGSNLDIANATFTGNKAGLGQNGFGRGGAIFSEGGNLTVSDSDFINNTVTHQLGTAATGGAISAVNSIVELAGVTFTGNSGSSDTQVQGGAYFQDKGKLTMDGGLFDANNTTTGSSILGGAMALWQLDQDSSIKNVDFTDNVSTADETVRGGALFIRTEDGNVSLDNVNFIGNVAESKASDANVWDTPAWGNYKGYANAMGGALAISGEPGSNGKTNINGGEFKNNSAVSANGEAFGGAISITNAKVDFTGDIAFSNNTANGALNDIYLGNTYKDGSGVPALSEANFDNANVTFGAWDSAVMDFGEASFSNGVSTDFGGISGNGIVNFANGSTINAYLSSTAVGRVLIASKELYGAGSTLNLYIENAWNGKNLFENDSYDNGFQFDNKLYTLNDQGSEQTLNLKDAASLQADNGLTKNQAIILQNMVANDVRNDITVGLQDLDVANAKQKLKAMDMNASSNNSAAIASSQAAAGAASSRMAMFGLAGGEEEDGNCSIDADGNRVCTGRAGGDRLDSKFSPWIKGIYNHTKNTQGQGFRSNGHGVAFGAESYVTPNTMLGIGFSRMFNDIRSDGLAATDVSSNGLFAYGKYKPADWYVEGVVSGSKNDYKNSVGSDWHNYSYGAQAMAGYVYGIFDTKAGMRYTYVKNGNYKDAFGSLIEQKNASVATAVVGTEVSKDYELRSDFTITPLARVAATYDVQSTNNIANVTLAGANSSFQLNGERLHRAALEAGIGLRATKDNMELELSADGEFRDQHQSYTGLAKFKYNF